MTEIASDEVHVWRASLDDLSIPIREMTSWLSADERERASRFRVEIHRSRFAAARGLLRLLLARYRSTTPDAVQFAYGQHGKPSLAGDTTLHFNVSHTEGWAVYALARVEVGVDIQELRARTDYARIAARFFSPGEVAELQALPPDRAARAFVACWTRKEAYLKARGLGLSLLSTFDVAGGREPQGAWLPVVPVTNGSGDADSAGWHVHALPASAEYEGSVAARDSARRLCCRDY